MNQCVICKRKATKMLYEPLGFSPTIYYFVCDEHKDLMKKKLEERQIEALNLAEKERIPFNQAMEKIIIKNSLEFL